MKVGLIITAAGTSQRFGATNKLLIPIFNQPLIIEAIKNSLEIPSVSEIIVTSDPGIHDVLQDLIESQLPTHPVQVVAGGKTRHESVKSGFQTLKDVDVVFIHDAARPFPSPQLLRRLFEASQSHPVVIPGLPVTDTIKRVDHETVQETLSRSELIAVQTPQVFHYDILTQLYKKKWDENKMTDEAMMAELGGHTVHVVAGERQNMKVTFPEDIEILKLILTSESSISDG